jgi:PhnB protein
MSGSKSQYESSDLCGVRPYLLVGDAAAAIEFYRCVFAAEELERHSTPNGGIGHAKIRIGDTILEIGEHPEAVGRPSEQLPRIGLRLYVDSVDETFAQAVEAGATGEAPTDRPNQGSRGATVYDPFGLTWWIATPLPSQP